MINQTLSGHWSKGVYDDYKASQWCISNCRRLVLVCIFTICTCFVRFAQMSSQPVNGRCQWINLRFYFTIYFIKSFLVILVIIGAFVSILTYVTVQTWLESSGVLGFSQTDQSTSGVWRVCHYCHFFIWCHWRPFLQRCSFTCLPVSNSGHHLKPPMA